MLRLRSEGKIGDEVMRKIERDLPRRLTPGDLRDNAVLPYGEGPR